MCKSQFLCTFKMIILNVPIYGKESQNLIKIQLNLNSFLFSTKDFISMLSIKWFLLEKNNKIKCTLFSVARQFSEIHLINRYVLAVAVKLNSSHYILCLHIMRCVSFFLVGAFIEIRFNLLKTFFCTALYPLFHSFTQFVQ